MTITEDRPVGEEAAIYDTQPRDVVAAIARVMTELGGIDKLSPADRQARGMGGGDTGIKYAYRGIDQIAGAAQPLLGKYGVVIVPSVIESKVEQIVVNDRPWTDTWVRVHWIIYGPGGINDHIGGVTEGLGRDNADKGANKAMTSAAKNLLLRLLMIGDSNDDSDGHTYERDQVDTGPQPLTQSWLNDFTAKVESEGFQVDMVLWSAFGNNVPSPLMPEHVPALRDAVARIRQAEEEMRHDEKPGGGDPPELPLEPESNPDVPPVTRPQIARIKAEHDRLGYNRQQGLEMTSSIVERDVKTHNALTWEEAENVIEALGNIKRADEN